MPVMNVVTDLDGTICDYTHRLAHLKTRNWHEFNRLCVYDKPIIPILDLVQAMHSYGARIYVFTARPIDYYKQTKAWLNKYRVPFVDIYMRPTDDTRSDKAVKSDFIKTWFPAKKN